MGVANDKIATVVITVRLTAGNSAGFEMRADEASTAGPGALRFGASGIGHSNEGLLKEVLQKLLDSFPERPISLCLDGSVIRSDANCPGRAAAALVATAPKPESVKKVPAKPRGVKKASPKPKGVKKVTAKPKGTTKPK